jgi:hypothetical protein
LPATSNEVPSLFVMRHRSPVAPLAAEAAPAKETHCVAPLLLPALPNDTPAPLYELKVNETVSAFDAVPVIVP